MRRDDELRNVLPIGLLDLAEAVKRVRMRGLVALAEMEDVRARCAFTTGTTVGNHVATWTSASGRVDESNVATSWTLTGTSGPVVPGVPRDEDDVVPARLQAGGVLDDDLDAAGDFEGLEDVDDPHLSRRCARGSTSRSRAGS